MIKSLDFRTRLVALIVFLVFCISSFSSIFIFIKRNELMELEWQSASLGDVYGVPYTGPQIRGFSYENRHLTIKLENIGDCKKWRVSGPDRLKFEHLGQYPRFPVRKGLHDYIVVPGDCSGPPVAEQMVFTVQLVPAIETLTTVTTDVVGKDFVRLVNMPLVFSLRSGPGFDRWAPPLDDFSEEEINAAREFLAQHQISASMSPLEKATRIARAVDEVFSRGRPPEYLNVLSPGELLDEALSERAQIFSDRHRSLVQMFVSNVAQLPSRIVWAGRVVDGVNLGSLAFVESYISEQARWAYSDIANGISHITDKDGNVLNAADVLSVISNHAGGGLSAWSSVSPKVKAVPWGDVTAKLTSKFNKNTTLTFWGAHDRSLFQIKLPPLKQISYKLRRYLFEPRLYFGYQHSLNLHWLRGGLLILSLISGMLLLLLIWPRKRASGR